MSKSENMNKKELRKMLAEENLTPNHRGRGRTKSEIRQDYAEYEKRKKVAFEAEERNHSHLVLFLASDGNNPEKDKKFYNMGGNSAIIYAYDIAPRIGRKDVTLRPDLDSTRYKFKTGMAKISNLPLLEEKLAQIGIDRVPTKTGDLIAYFDLKREYTADMIRSLLKERRDEIKEANKILYTDVVFPDIHKLTMDLRIVTYHKLMKMTRADREVLQDKILEPVFKISDTYALMAHGDMKVKESGRIMVENLDIMMDRVAMLMDLELLDTVSVSRIGKIMAGLRNLVVGKMVNQDESDD